MAIRDPWGAEKLFARVAWPRIVRVPFRKVAIGGIDDTRRKFRAFLKALAPYSRWLRRER